MSSSAELLTEILGNKSSDLVEDADVITYRRRKRKRDKLSGELDVKDVSMPSSLAERLRVRSDKKPLYKIYDTDDEDDHFVIQRKMPNLVMPSKKTKVANFKYIDDVEAAAAVAATELARKQSMTELDASNSGKASYWEDLLKDIYQVHQVEAMSNLGKGKQSCKQDMVPESLAERLRVSSDKKPLYKVNDTDNDDEPFVIQRKKPKLEMPSENSKNLGRSSTAEKLRDKSNCRPVYRFDDSDDSDDIPIAQSSRLNKERKMKEDINLKPSNLDKGAHIADDSDEDELPIKHLNGNHKADHCSEMSEKSMQGNLAYRSSYTTSINVDNRDVLIRKLQIARKKDRKKISQLESHIKRIEEQFTRRFERLEKGQHRD